MLGRHLAIGLGIAIILPLLIYYGVATVDSPPRYADYVKTNVVAAAPEERQAQILQMQSEQKAFQAAERDFARVLFYVAVPLGYVAILASGFLPISAVSTGLLFGGIFIVIDGHWTYWSFIADWQRFVSLLIAGAIIAAIAYRKAPKRSEEASA
jgi:hypothetical protein